MDNMKKMYGSPKSSDGVDSSPVPQAAGTPDIPATSAQSSSEDALVNPCPGDRNQNPEGIGLLALIAEDYRTHDRSLFEPGFLAIAVHRFGNWRMNIQPRLVRAPFSLLYKILYTLAAWFWGIDIEYSVKLGRRVRIWHHGGIVIGAISIGDDVHIRHNTTMGVAGREEKWKKPIIEDRVDVGTGACILGDVTVGHDSVIGANTVVVRSFPPYSTLVGVPARLVNLKSQ